MSSVIPKPPAPKRHISAALGAPPRSPPLETVNQVCQEVEQRSDICESHGDWEEGEIEEFEEEYDFFGEEDEKEMQLDIDESPDKESKRYQEKIRKVLQLRKLPLTVERKSSNITLSVDSEDKKSKLCIPPPDGFKQYFESHFLNEIKDVKWGKSLPVGTLPLMYKAKAMR